MDIDENRRTKNVHNARERVGQWFVRKEISILSFPEKDNSYDTRQIIVSHNSERVKVACVK